jgi:hypothetical protein
MAQVATKAMAEPMANALAKVMAKMTANAMV